MQAHNQSEKLHINLIITANCPALLGIATSEEATLFSDMLRARDPTFTLVKVPFSGITHDSRMNDAKLVIEIATRLIGNPITFDQVNHAVLADASRAWGDRPAVLFTFTLQDRTLFENPEGFIYDIREPVGTAVKEQKGADGDSGAGTA